MGVYMNGSSIDLFSGRPVKTVPGFSPTIVESPDNNTDVYKLVITTIDGEMVTPNLMGGR